MHQYPQVLSNLIAQFNKLPGIGPKTAQRLAFHVLKMSEKDVGQFSEALIRLKTDIRECSLCCNFTDIDPCSICQDEKRNKTILCIVEEPKDVAALERTREYKGLYHVLHGSLSPMEGIGPGELKVKELLGRLQQESEIKEIIIATNPNIEGETTALYLAKLLTPLGYLVTRIAHGLPVGGELEYADEMTLAKAFEGRKVIV